MHLSQLVQNFYEKNVKNKHKGNKTKTNKVNDTKSVENIKGCVCYIFAGVFLDLNESTCQIKENVFISL